MKRWIGVAWIMVGMTIAAHAAPYVILSDGKTRYDGRAIRASSNGDIILTKTDGTQITLTRAQYSLAVADKPPKFDEAQQRLTARQADAAITLLKAIQDEYRWLEWDKKAAELLGRAYAEKKDFNAALALYKDVFTRYPRLEAEPAFAWGYRQALAGAKQYSQLTNKEKTGLLDKLIREGTTGDAALALSLRGDIYLATERGEDAFRDWLRVIKFYEREAAAAAPALQKAAAYLQKKGDNRAQNLYKLLKEKYPDSPEARSAP